MPPRSPLIVWMLRLAIVAACIGLLVVAVWRDPMFEFDESNQLRIVARPLSEILEILDHEQNFPLHYVLAHGFYALGGTLPVVLFDFAIWLASVVVVERILRHFTATPASRLALLLCLVSIPYFNYYAFFVRMYGMTTLAIAVQILCLLDGRKRWLRVAQLTTTALHPIGIVAALATTATELIDARFRRPLAPLAWGAACIAIFAIHVFAKSDPARIYLGSGVAYISVLEGGLSSSGPLYYLDSVYQTRKHSIAGWQFAGFTLALFVAAQAFISLRLWREPRFRMLAIAAAPLILIPIVLRNSFSEHHAAFFVLPFALFAIACLHESWSRGWPVDYATLALGVALGLAIALPIGPPWLKTLLASTILAGSAFFVWPRTAAARSPWVGQLLIAVLVTCHTRTIVSSIQQRARLEVYHDDVCEALARASPDDLLLTNYTHLNIVDRCANPRPRTYLIERFGVLDTHGLDTLAILVEQARRGGTLDDAFTVQRLLQDHRIVGPILARHAAPRLLLYLPFSDCGSGLRRITFPRYELESCASGVFTLRRVR